ncbi:MAG: hypothetical protein HC905_22910 [Bacteroidales bacterium]|nr:hypothetical protein [Bacteroidales bacterium]
MKYYQFTYPGSQLFKHTVDITDSTQFAVYVMHKGMAKQIFVIEVNRQPVYYSWVNQPKAYSFYVSPVGKKEISIRLHDRVLVLDSIAFEECRKTILSLDLDQLPQGTKVIKLEKKFTQTEINRHINYVSSFKSINTDAYLESKNEFIPLTNNYREILAGPVIPGRKTLNHKYGFYTISYNHTGGYTYAFEDNVVYKLNAYHLLPIYLSDATYDPMTTINQKVVNKLLFLQEPSQNYIKWKPSSVDIINPVSRLKILLPAEMDQSGVNAVLFQSCKTKDILNSYEDIYRGNQSKFYSLPSGLNNVIVIYNSGKYLKMDSIFFRNNIISVINLNKASFLPADTFSREWLLRHPVAVNFSGRTEVLTQVKTHSYEWSSNGNVRGVITDETGEPLPGATIVVKGTNIGTVSDIDGNFSIRIDEPNAKLVFCYLGYITEEVNVTSGSAVSVTLTPDIMQLSEVVVVGYGTHRKSDLTGSVAGINAERLSAPEEKSEETESAPEGYENHDAEQKLYQELLNLKSIRSNFSDVGFWEPKLFTNNRGESKFKITFPDDITRWNAVVYAMNRHLQTGTGRKSIKSYKPLMAELHVPQFLTCGDSAFFLGKVLNYTNDSLIAGSVQWKGAETDFEKNIRFNSFHTDKLPVHVTTTDSLTTQYVFTRDDGYTDGERRTLPVNKQGVERADRKPLVPEKRR